MLTAALRPSSPGKRAAAGNMAGARADASGTVLSDGGILIAGGANEDGVLAGAEFLRAPAESPAPPPMAYARAKHSCVVLSDGRVLVAGGRTTGGGALNAAEVFDPSSVATAAPETCDPVAGKFAPVWGLSSTPRKDHAAAVLRDGKVLIAGGSEGSAALDTADIYDPATGEVLPAGKLAARRAGLSATTAFARETLS